jgi:hypothetical protein
MNRLSRLALAGSTALTLAITHAYLDFVSFEYEMNGSEHLNALTHSLGRLETALALIALALTAWTFTPKRED